MDVTSRMLGELHEADLERDALKWRRAAELRGQRSSRPQGTMVSRVIGLLLFIAAFLLLLAGCGGAGASDGGPTSAAATARVVRATERERLRALVARNVDVAQKLHADDYELINPLGEVVSREEYIDTGAAFAYAVWKPITPIRVRVYGDAAVIRYESELQFRGRPRGHYWHTDLYEKRAGQWQVVWSQTTGTP